MAHRGSCVVMSRFLNTIYSDRMKIRCKLKRFPLSLRPYACQGPYNGIKSLKYAMSSMVFILLSPHLFSPWSAQLPSPPRACMPHRAVVKPVGRTVVVGQDRRRRCDFQCHPWTYDTLARGEAEIQRFPNHAGRSLESQSLML